jgi:chemotaxis methyl-accepting protein methylase
MDPLGTLVEQVRQERGLDLVSYKLSFVQRRLAVRMRACGCSDYATYGQLLRREPEEYGLLLDALTINLTRFFRDPTTFQAIEERVLPALLEARVGERRLQIWSAGCAAGEEPYSLAIMLRERFEAVLKGWQVQILAGDMDEKMLEKARRGLYDAFSFQGLALQHQAWLERYCVASSGYRQLAGDVRRMVSFQRHDLTRDPPPAGLDLLLCRNVLIYFEREQQNRVYSAFHQALRPDGLLILGKTEVLPMIWTRCFAPVDLHEHIYRRIEPAQSAAGPIRNDR